MSFNAMAADTDNCSAEARVFVQAYIFQQNNSPPELAYEQAKAVAAGLIPDEKIKRIVNMFYFDENFAYVGNEFNLEYTVFKACMRDWKPQYEPLK